MQGDHRRIKKNDFFKSDKFFFLILTLFLLFFNFNALKVRITDLNYWDESQYIIFGKLLMQGDFPVFSWSPFTAFFFGLLYLPFHGTANWLPLVATLGRFIIYLLLLLSAYLVGREIKFIPSKFAIFGMALVYPVMVPMLKFQSDALFAVNSAFALWQLLRFINAEQEKNLWLASLFVGFSALTRNDGLILFLVFLFFVLFLLKTPNINLKRKLAASIMPFAALLLGYILLYGLTTGSFNMGTKERTWGAFRQGQYFIYGDQADCAANQLRFSTPFATIRKPTLLD